jgi:hypothetical protein
LFPCSLMTHAVEYRAGVEGNMPDADTAMIDR